MSMLFKRIKDWAVSITSFRTGDVIAVDGPSGNAKMPYSDLAKEVIKDSANNTAATEADLVAGSNLPIMTANGPKSLPGNTITPKTYAQNVAHSIAPEFDPTRTSENPYKIGERVVNGGRMYVAINQHYGPWNANNFTQKIIVSQNRVASIGFLNFTYDASSNSLSVQNSEKIQIVDSGVTVPSGSTATYTTTSARLLYVLVVRGGGLVFCGWDDLGRDDVLLTVFHANSSDHLFEVVNSILPYSINGITNEPLYPSVVMYSKGGITFDNLQHKVVINQNIVCQFQTGSITISKDLYVDYNFNVSSTTLYALIYDPATQSIGIRHMGIKSNCQSLILLATIYASSDTVVSSVFSQVAVKIEPVDTSLKLTAVFGNGYLDVNLVERVITVHRNIAISVDGDTPKLISDGSKFAYEDTGSSLNGIYFDTTNNSLVVSKYSAKLNYPCIATFSTQTGYTGGFVRVSFNGGDTHIVPKGEYFGERIKLKNLYTYYDFLSLSGVTPHQSLAIHGDYALCLNYDDNAGAKVQIYKFSTNSVVATLDLLSNDSFVPHCNTAVFGKTKLSDTSIVPLLYVSKWDYQSDKSCLVYDITESGGVYSASLVQTITPNVSSSIIGEGDIDWVVDTDNDKLYAFAYKLQGSSSIEIGNEEMIAAFNLPTTSSSQVTLTDSDVVDSFVLPILNISQDKVYSNDKVYIIAGWGHGTQQKNCLYVVDLSKKKVVSTVNLGDVAEPEGLSIYDGRLVFDFGGDSIKQFVFD